MADDGKGRTETSGKTGPDVIIGTEGRAGVIRLNRPGALNALNYDMCLEIDAALIRWRDDPAIALVLLEAEGDRAFSAGGDIAAMYRRGIAGDHDYARRFWRDEYRMNARIFEYPKPIISFLNGFVMGGGVGVGCHGSHRLVREDTRIAMPECGIGLVPDVGGTFLLALAPGRLGEYLGLTGARMGPADAIAAGFADSFVPGDRWAQLRARLVESGDPGAIIYDMTPPPEGALEPARMEIDVAFGAGTLPQIAAALATIDGAFGTATLETLKRGSPLSMTATLELLGRLRRKPALREALAAEYRFTARAMAQGDFLEGIRAQIIDKDRTPHWRHTGYDVPAEEVDAILAPLGEDELTFEEETR
ncbi:enoyl-CoA hydratase/isomerase family protein [Acidimangrovimonas sediminis]|uniref:enoyl-CoA hydratase/isomerase family protein n=1 Tax=Acidimangrovimonas sediminis TaxID=2056283 RepID=UPI000C80C572|nr:enoyl-CoA hydratase/isomerase family protein [Acidimangrovimonas sediminis]